MGPADPNIDFTVINWGFVQKAVKRMYTASLVACRKSNDEQGTH